MNWQDANTIIRLISGLFLWCGVPVSLAAGHRSKKEAKYDLNATFAYQHTHAPGVNSVVQVPEGQQEDRH